MKILLIQDRIGIDLEKSCTILNRICKTIRFESYGKSINLGLSSTYIELKEETKALNQMISKIEKDYTIYITDRRYEDNYFFHKTEDGMILSFFGWEDYTSLPLENGLFYFIADMLALHVDRSFRHQELTGCIYDFLWNKVGVDIGMKEAHICGPCIDRIKRVLNVPKPSLNILSDVKEILDVISNASKLGKSVLEVELDKSLVISTWYDFEDEVAQLYRKLGAKVKQNVDLSGFQIDIYVEEETPSKQKIRTSVECKFSKSKKTGNRAVNDFSRVVQTLKESKLVDKGVIVSNSGFSSEAFSVSKTTGIELLRLEDLREMVNIKTSQRERTEFIEVVDMEKKSPIKKEKSPQIYVLMPLSPGHDDIYYLGIHEIAETLSCSCERVDEEEFDIITLKKIQDSIADSGIIIAEVSSPNPNVYFELGIAQALKKPVILVIKDKISTSFDLDDYNHIIYENIIDLRNKLKNRLEKLLYSCNA